MDMLTPLSVQDRASHLQVKSISTSVLQTVLQQQWKRFEQVAHPIILVSLPWAALTQMQMEPSNLFTRLEIPLEEPLMVSTWLR